MCPSVRRCWADSVAGDFCFLCLILLALPVAVPLKEERLTGVWKLGVVDGRHVFFFFFIVLC